jgi:hypothetical protein
VVRKASLRGDIWVRVTRTCEIEQFRQRNTSAKALGWDGANLECRRKTRRPVWLDLRGRRRG